MRLFLALAASVLLHFLFVAAPLQLSEAPAVDPTIEIEFINTKVSSDSNKTVVRSTETPEELKRDHIVKDEARFFSAENVRVKKEMKASATGKTKNRSDDIAQNRDQVPEEQKKKTQANKDQTKLDLSPRGDDSFLIAEKKAEENDTQVNLDAFRAPSTLGEHLPDDIEVGAFTVLNVDFLTYYSFFHRVEDLIRYRWENRIRAQTSQNLSQRFRGIKKERWHTQLRVIMASNGDILKISVLQSSGNPGFDYAATKAFAEAAYLPNPPAELVNSNGQIVLDYGFTVIWKPAFLARD